MQKNPSFLTRPPTLVAKETEKERFDVQKQEEGKIKSELLEPERVTRITAEKADYVTSLAKKAENLKSAADDKNQRLATKALLHNIGIADENDARERKESEKAERKKRTS